MTYSIDTLRSKMETVGGFTKGNRFQLTMGTPNAIVLPTATTELLQYVCEAVSIPTRSLATSPEDIYGPPREIAYRSTFTEMALSFYLDNDMSIKTYFDTWQEIIVDQITGNTNYWDEYTCSINIKKLADTSEKFDDKITYEINLIEAYPSLVGEVGLGHTQGSEILKLPVTFKYKRWERVQTSVATQTPPPQIPFSLQ